ncbi:MAG TPA: hypothetical protein VGO11_22625 [Chthoniobacteraceae bacterium]|jgi:hypothetical protein|nr:hypothetical protein [Chthoniobacteraceae bacterium]
MTQIALELDERLRRLDARTAERVESVVREVLALTGSKEEPKDELGYPLGYFESTAGSFAKEPLERPVALPFENREVW